MHALRQIVEARAAEAGVKLAISLEVQQIDPVGSVKQNNLHARLKARAETLA